MFIKGANARDTVRGAGRAAKLFYSLWIAGLACGGWKCALLRRDGYEGNMPLYLAKSYRVGKKMGNLSKKLSLV